MPRKKKAVTKEKPLSIENGLPYFKIKGVRGIKYDGLLGLIYSGKTSLPNVLEELKFYDADGWTPLYRDEETHDYNISIIGVSKGRGVRKGLENAIGGFQEMAPTRDTMTDLNESHFLRMTQDLSPQEKLMLAIAVYTMHDYAYELMLPNNQAV